jgi:hypothetical protein
MEKPAAVAGLGLPKASYQATLIVCVSAFFMDFA